MAIPTDGKSEAAVKKSIYLKSHESRQLKTRLTDAEKLKLGDALADLMAKGIQLEEELAGIKADYKGKVETARASAHELARTIRNGYQMQLVKCDLALNFETGIATSIRCDTDEVVDTRAITEKERQMSLPEAAL